MAIQQIVLLLINVVGGIAVIGSYITGLITHPGTGNALWGGMPVSVRPIYTVSMVLAAFGYFAFIYFVLFRIMPEQVQVAGRFGYSIFYMIFIGMLLPSVLWMPFTYIWIGNPGTGMWIGIRMVLIIVGLSSCALVWAILSLNSREPALPYWLAVAGSAYFAFHTAILDMLLWPVFFRM